MFSQRQYYFSRLARSHPILKFINVYDRQSFIRQYVLDNIFICVFAYVLFYLTLWYANRVIKKIDKSNKELLEIVEDNKTKLADVIVLKDERQEYQEVVMKARGIQQATSLWLENEINRLNNELSVTADKLTSLEKILKKINFSECYGKSLKAAKSTDSLGKINVQKVRTLSQTRSKMSRYSSRRSRRLRHNKSMVSLSLDRLNSALRCQRSDSSSDASAETSSVASSRGTRRRRQESNEKSRSLADKKKRIH
ncbi:uncharacterized protein [Chelonus insularis]|uniref:uncharacterized protein isoform X1 n=1 Tax=Chelonus insularis TaxID=460826 RepID=UPI00158BFF5C|nr:uncharacterized protein LOC118070271 isoform X1 [Chelonus insularis]